MHGYEGLEASGGVVGVGWGGHEGEGFAGAGVGG